MAIILHSCFKKLGSFISKADLCCNAEKHYNSPTCCFSLLLTQALSSIHTSCLHAEAAGNMAGDLIFLAAVSLLSAFQQCKICGIAWLGLGEVSTGSEVLEIIL